MEHVHASERLAGEDTCAVYRCQCGCLQIHVGSVTIRLSAEALEGLSRVLTQAVKGVPPPAGPAH